MRFRYLLCCVFYIISSGIQADDLESDTIRLEGITITGSYFERFGAGSYMEKIDSIGLSTYSAQNLNDLIKSTAPIHFKSYGGSMLSSVSFRGTGAGHTAVLWNGMNVNQPTVGQSDFSLFPVFAFEDIKIHYGAASSRYGSDAIGGGILLNSKPQWNINRLRTSLSLSGGSYGSFISKAELIVKPFRNLLATSKFYRNANKNDFTYRNITKPGKPVEKQQNASVFQYGLIQDIYIKTTDRSLLSLNSWFNFSDRDIQPTMTNDDSNETQQDKSFRMTINYHIQTKVGFFETKLGYLWDYLLYDKQSEIISRQYIAQAAYEDELNEWKFRLGTNYNRISVDSENFQNGQKENRSNVYGGVVYDGLPETTVSFNINQQFISGYQVPIAPSLGITYRYHLSSTSDLTAEGQASLNYRVPTLNDRYWQPGGREDLQPERSQNVDGTISYGYHGHAGLKLSLAGFFYRVNDWILWMPGGSYWVPDNVRRVYASGLEIKTKITYPLGISEIDLNGYYSLTNSIIQQSGWEDDRVIGSQLPYTPVHLAGFNVQWINHVWHAGIYSEYTGKTYITTDNESEIPGYILVHLKVSRNIRIRNQLLAVDARINNMFNEAYQNVLYRAMPGRTYMIGIQFLFNN